MSENENKKESVKKTTPKKRVFKVTPQGKHVPNCVHEMVVVRNNQLVYEKWLFRRTAFPCGSCNTVEHTVFMRTSPLNVVIRSCETCGVTEAVSPRKSNGDPQAYPLETRVINAAEAREVLLRSKVKAKFLPPELTRILKSKPQKVLSPDELEAIELE